MNDFASIVRRSARSLTVAAALASSWFASHAEAYVTTRVCILRGAEEVPSNASGGVGAGKFVIDTDANIVQFRISVGGLSTPETAAHIHGAAGPGVNAGVAGKKLRPARQWTPTAVVPAPADRVPASDATGKREGQSTIIRIINRSIDAGGWGDPIAIQPSLGVSPVEIPLENLTLGDPAVNSLLFMPLTLGPISIPPDGAVEFAIPTAMLPAGGLPRPVRGGL